MAVILSMLQPLLAFAVVVLLHCRLMPWQLPLTGVITIVIAAGWLIICCGSHCRVCCCQCFPAAPVLLAAPWSCWATIITAGYLLLHKSLQLLLCCCGCSCSCHLFHPLCYSVSDGLLLLLSELPWPTVDCCFLFSLLLRSFVDSSFAIICLHLPSLAIVCRHSPSFAIVCRHLPSVCHPHCCAVCYCRRNLHCSASNCRLLCFAHCLSPVNCNLCWQHHIAVIIIVRHWPNNLLFFCSLYGRATGTRYQLVVPLYPRKSYLGLLSHTWYWYQWVVR